MGKMKIITVAAATILLISLSGCGKVFPEGYSSMPDTLSADELKMPEKEPAYKCIETKYEDGELKSRKECVYNKYDKIIALNEFDISSGEMFRGTECAYEYNADGYVRKTIMYGRDGINVDRVLIDNYNADDKMLNGFFYIINTDDILQKHMYFEYKYDAHGNQTEFFSVTSDRGKGTVYTDSYKYDDKGNILKKTSVNSYKKYEKDEYTYTYDDAGNMLTETYKRYSKKEILSESSYKYEYDSSGNLIREESSFSDERADKVITYEYDNRGNLIKEETISGNGSTPNVITYEYDAQNRKIREVNGSSETVYEYEDY